MKNDDVLGYSYSWKEVTFLFSFHAEDRAGDYLHLCGVGSLPLYEVFGGLALRENSLEVGSNATTACYCWMLKDLLWPFCSLRLEPLQGAI